MGRDPGSTGFTAVVAIGAADGAVKAGVAEVSDAALTDAAVSTAGVVLMDEMALPDAAASRAVPLAVDSTVIALVGSMAAVADSTVVVEAGSTAAAVAMVAATGN